jgi:hypothetical protein
MSLTRMEKEGRGAYLEREIHCAIFSRFMHVASRAGLRAGDGASLLVLALGAFLTLGFASAADGPEGPRTLQAVPAGAPITVDGRLDEPDWARANVASGFTQFEPDEGAPASQHTEVRVLYGASAIYIGAHLFDDPALIRRPLTRRDQVGDADYFSVSIDGFSTGRTAYTFGVTAAGVQIDAVSEIGQNDFSWDAVWQSAVRTVEDGWVVEMAIPYSMLRFPDAREQSWWIQFSRTLSREGERTYWEPVARQAELVGFIAGRLAGLRGISPRANVQVRPYSLSRLTRAPEAGMGTTYFNETAFDVGADLKIGVGSNLIFDATINPDFGQVEADPEVLNLTTFETFFQERRPFFLEGTSIFDYLIGPGDGPILYTRRIGGLGRLVGASKLTGRFGSGLSFGLLGAATSDGFEGPDRFTGEDFEPDIVYLAGRVKREFGDRSYAGAALTYFDGFGGDFIGDKIRSVVLGADYDLRLGSTGAFRWDGSLTMSRRVFGEELGLSTRHGFALYSGVEKIRGSLLGGIGVRVYSDGFQPNEMGFFVENDVIRTNVGTQLLLNGGRPFGPFRLALIGASADQKWTFLDNTNLGLRGRWYSWWYFKNYQRISVRGTFIDVGGVDVRESRGLGPVANLAGYGFTLEYSTDTRRRLIFNPRATIAVLPESDGSAWTTEAGVFWTASDRLALSLSSRYERRDNIRSWVANETFLRDPAGYLLGERANRVPGGIDDLIPLAGDPAPLDQIFSGFAPFEVGGLTAYYAAVFGARDQRSVDTAIRSTYTFRPNLSLQLYSQLFAARFRYDRFRLLAGTDDLPEISDYPRRRDESRRSLNVNAVMRWEYRPGSTLFLVWAHSRLAFEGGYRLFDPQDPEPSPFDSGTFRLALDTFDLMPTNVVLIKLNYLLMR